MSSGQPSEVPGSALGAADADGAADTGTGTEADADTGADTDADTDAGTGAVADTGTGTDTDADAASDPARSSLVPQPAHASTTITVRTANPPACLGRSLTEVVLKNTSGLLIDC